MTTLRTARCSAARRQRCSRSAGRIAQGEKPRNRSMAARSKSARCIATLSALSWDPHDWNWKLNHDTGQFYEQLVAGDLDKSKRKGGKHPFIADA